MKIYVYIEYNEDSMSEKLIKVSTDIEVLKKYLKERVESYFNCPWDKIKEQYFSEDSECILSDTFTNYHDYRDNFLIWEIAEGNMI